MNQSEYNKREVRILLAVVALIALVHCALWFTYYNQTALGESPALDNRQTLELAQAMADDSLAEEPFHRAPLYPYLLSIFLSLGLPYELLPLLARWVNAFALALTAASAAFVALRLWRKSICGWLAGLFVALNPVFIFFAGDAFDILLATACLSLALAILQVWLIEPTLKRSLIIGLVLTVGAALRSHLLPLAILWPIAAFILSNRHRLQHAALPTAPLIISFLLLGVANLNVSGEFRIMPWQGAYNLWAGNGADANGRIYAQKIRVDFDGGYDNPAKLESIALYEQETGNSPPHSIDAMNAHWKEKAFDYIGGHPAEWLGLMLRKAYYFLNSYEQYDNKTYSFHNQYHPLLRWNPIHWGLLLILAVSGAILALTDKSKRPQIIIYILCFAAYAAGTILFYTSNRFRLPMLPVLSILASGVVLIPAYWQHAARTWKLVLIACISLTIAIAYSNFFNARDKNTWEEDYALLANASLRTGRDTSAIENAKNALAMNPTRADMHAVQAQALFNQWAFSEQSPRLDADQVNLLLASTHAGANAERNLIALIGIYEWKLGRKEEAVSTWESIRTSDALARLCLFWTGKAPPPNQSELTHYNGHPSQDLLQAAANIASPKDAKGVISDFMNQLLKPVIVLPNNAPSN